jgi:hypothetical protein
LFGVGCATAELIFTSCIMILLPIWMGCPEEYQGIPSH